MPRISHIVVLLALGSGLPASGAGLVMVDKVGGYVRFFDPATDRELGSFRPAEEAGVRPHELALAPDHARAYVTVYGDGVFGNNPNPGHTIAIVDLRARALIGSIDVAPYKAPHGIQVDAAGRLYVVCDLSHALLIIDPSTRRINTAIDVGAAGHWIALLPDASKAYVSNHGDQPFISVIDLETRRMSSTIPLPNSSMGLALSPDGKTLLAADRLEPYLHVISTVTDREIDKVRIEGAAKGIYKVFFSPDGKWVLTCLPNGQINILSADSLAAPQHTLQSAGTALMGFAFAADGKTALVGNHGEGTVTRFDLATATIINTFPAGKGVETLAYY